MRNTEEATNRGSSIKSKCPHCFKVDVYTCTESSSLVKCSDCQCEFNAYKHAAIVERRISKSKDIEAGNGEWQREMERKVAKLASEQREAKLFIGVAKGIAWAILAGIVAAAVELITR